MHFQAVLVYHAPDGGAPPPALEAFAREHGFRLLPLHAAEEVTVVVNRSFPAAIILAGDAASGPAELCRALKSDTFSAVVPVVFLVRPGDGGAVMAGFEAGADEVLTPDFDAEEWQLRLRNAIQRADRDVSVNPTTRLPGTSQIQRDIGERIRAGTPFAVCYADLDHFKEFNDRYGYTAGDRVILLLSRILRDVVKAYAPAGFIGHIGGDDFIFTVPLEAMRECCELIIEIFDELIPFQYREEDRRAGYFLGKDRRGTIHRIPLMTVSIGVVTSKRRTFSHPARVNELATEMKTYAKTLTGSVYAVDRRADAPSLRALDDAPSDAMKPIAPP
jgi:GGDEF domain-containing protein